MQFSCSDAKDLLTIFGVPESPQGISGEEIQVMMEQWVENVCRLSEGDMRDLLSLVKEFSLD